jgi:hypothetical protein
VTGAIIALLVVPPAIAVVAGTRLVAIAPLVAWPLYYAGLNERWWGCCGTGDGWPVVAALLTIAGVASTVAAADLRRRRALR